ncbi:MAG: copper amine oxidase N-terminal domain-containing protein [Ruminococcaceae bacterium]|nr:copper amine oxidase N-terminal domain-containing protein [Oscillospiraceae bacterium]
MKSLWRTIIMSVIACLLSCNIAFAVNYTYFDIIETNYPSDSIVSDTVSYVNKVYYMSGSDGLFYSHDAKSWHFIDGSRGARIISDKKASSDFLIVFYEGYLVKSYDGANFELLYKFAPDTVIHFQSGIYTAYEKANKNDKGANVYCSLDAKNWTNLTDYKVLDGQFTIDQYNNMYIVNGLNTENGIKSAILTPDSDTYLLPYDYVSYDVAKKIYTAIKSENNEIKLYYSYLPDRDYIALSLPNAKPTLASYYNGSFYIATVYDDNFFDVYKCEDTLNWEFSDTFYMPLYKTTDTDKNLIETYLWHNCSINTVGVSILKTDKTNTTQNSSVILSDGLKLNIYGSVFGIASDKRPVNLISTDAINWHQADNATAFSILNNYSLRGGFMFVDRTNNHTVLSPKGNPEENLENKGIEVRVDGHYIAFDSEPTIINDRTLVPIRAIAEALGATVGFDDATKTITISKNGNTITMTVGADSAHITYYDGAEYDATLDCPSMIINDRTLVPVRFISEAFNKTVEWQADTKTVWITSK